ncbi:hypothetical protein [Tolypothrix sp. PCC 7910]|nr:hypothetical protein [Tolypothrix sp. PCC 7910]
MTSELMLALNYMLDKLYIGDKEDKKEKQAEGEMELVITHYLFPVTNDQ